MLQHVATPPHTHTDTHTSPQFCYPMIELCAFLGGSVCGGEGGTLGPDAHFMEGTPFLSHDCTVGTCLRALVAWGRCQGRKTLWKDKEPSAPAWVSLGMVPMSPQQHQACCGGLALDPQTFSESFHSLSGSHPTLASPTPALLPADTVRSTEPLSSPCWIPLCSSRGSFRLRLEALKDSWHPCL